MKLEAFDYALKKFQEVQGIQQNKPKVGGPDSIGPTSKDGGFGEMFANAIKEVDQMQKQADLQVEGLTLNKKGYTTHSAMLALEKADSAFQLMNNIRAKIIRAYEDVLRTQV